MAEEPNNLDEMERAIATNKARLKSSRRVLAGLEKRLKEGERAERKKNSDE